MIKRMIIMLLLVGLLLGGIFAFIDFKGKMIKQFMAAGSNPVQTVSSIDAQSAPWQTTLTAIGTVKAEQLVDVSAEVAGVVSEIYFNQGDSVKAGEPLVQLRADDDLAKLDALKASAELMRLTYQRSQSQFNAKAISQQIVDNDKANLNIALANIAQQQALLAKKRINAPFSGQLGLRLIDIGKQLNAGEAIATLQALDTVYVDFYLPQQAIAQIKTGQSVDIKTDTYPEQSFKGVISVINPKIDSDTRNIQIRATLKNPAHKLLTGMYVNINLNVGDTRELITIPRTAISFNPYGSTVYLLKKDKEAYIAEQRFVTTGETRGDQIAIIKGLQGGEKVVTSGQLKLRNGSPAIIDNSVIPSNDEKPQPVDN
jgi:membrane fusion protein (multidrug efflux system)